MENAAATIVRVFEIRSAFGCRWTIVMGCNLSYKRCDPTASFYTIRCATSASEDDFRMRMKVRIMSTSARERGSPLASKADTRRDDDEALGLAFTRPKSSRPG